MKPDDETIAKTIDAVNRRFYQVHHSAFNTTRQHGWPGWKKVMDAIETSPDRVLDIGCGNGRFARFLDNEKHPHSPPKYYLGLDANEELLSYASACTLTYQTRWRPWTWTHGSVNDEAPANGQRFDLVVAFGVLHHVYGRARRADFIRWCAQHVAPGGHLVISAWDFGRHARFINKTQPADVVLKETGIDLTHLEANDHFLGFGVDALPLRYCHWVSDNEASELMASMGQQGFPDARTRRIEDLDDLNRYWIWQRAYLTDPGDGALEGCE